MRKPRDWSVKQYVARVQEINSYLNLFPPFEEDQEMAEDELLNILEYSVPNSWQKEFVRTGYDPLDSDIKAFIDRCERIEFTEALDPSPTQPPTKKVKTGPRASQNRGSGKFKDPKLGAKSSVEAGKDCPLNGIECGHD